MLVILPTFTKPCRESSLQIGFNETQSDVFFAQESVKTVTLINDQLPKIPGGNRCAEMGRAKGGLLG